jgi:hypothetical protein
VASAWGDPSPGSVHGRGRTVPAPLVVPLQADCATGSDPVSRGLRFAPLPAGCQKRMRHAFRTVGAGLLSQGLVKRADLLLKTPKREET